MLKPLLNPILADESLTRGLGDPEARILIEWLVEEAETLALQESGRQAAERKVTSLRLRGRAVGRFVRLWCIDGAHPAALQLAATERFSWPLPKNTVDPCDLMQYILEWESSRQASCKLGSE